MRGGYLFGSRTTSNLEARRCDYAKHDDPPQAYGRLRADQAALLFVAIGFPRDTSRHQPSAFQEALLVGAINLTRDRLAAFYV